MAESRETGQENKKDGKGEGSSRLKEITEILRRNKILRGVGRGLFPSEGNNGDSAPE